MSDDEMLVYIILEFKSSDFSSSSSSSSGGFEFLASIALAALEEDTASSSTRSQRFIWRDRHSARERLMSMYFVDEPMFEDDVFRTRYHMLKRLFLKIVKDITASFHGFSLNRMRQTWRNCPHSLRGQYHRGDHERPTIILEVVASYDLWFWHAYFGVVGSNNDINVLKQSPLFIPEVNGKSSKYGCTINGHRYNNGYYLGDDIYPPWSCFVKAYAYVVARKEKIMKKLRESARKNVERAFGLLKNMWAIIDRSTRMRDKEKITNAMYVCVILHNMILKDDGNAISPVYIRDPPNDIRATDPNFLYHLRNEETNYMLRRDITEHVGDFDIDV